MLNYEDNISSPNISLTVRKHTLALVTLFIILTGPVLFDGLVFVAVESVLLVIWLWVSEWRVERNLIYLCFPLFLILILSTPSSIEYQIFPIAKDVFYVSKTIVALIVGSVLASHIGGIAEAFRVIVLASVFSAAYHHIEVFVHYSDGISVFSLRSAEGVRGYFVTVVGLAILLVNWKNPTLISRRNFEYWLCVAICMSSVVLAHSRTYYIMLAIMLITLNGWWRISLSNVLKLLLLTLFCLLVINIGSEVSDGEKNLFGKFSYSINEIVMRDYYEPRDINKNWRGFESYKAFLSFRAGNLYQMLLGHGMGSTIDLGRYILLGKNEMRNIPLLHNGYLYVLVKFGIIGVFLLVYMLIKIIKYGLAYERSVFDHDDILASRLMVGLGVSLIVSTFVIAGIFNGNMAPLVVLSAMFSSKAIYKLYR